MHLSGGDDRGHQDDRSNRPPNSTVLAAVANQSSIRNKTGAPMTVWALILATFGIAISLSSIMAIAWALRNWTGNSGWIDAVWTFGLGLVGLCSALMVLPGADG